MAPRHLLTTNREYDADEYDGAGSHLREREYAKRHQLCLFFMQNGIMDAINA